MLAYLLTIVTHVCPTEFSDAEIRNTFFRELGPKG